MKVYHGSLNQVKKPTLERCRSNTDFGKGFYTTTNIEQARRWALNKQKTAGGDSKTIVNIYEVDDYLLQNRKYKVKAFNRPMLNGYPL